MIFWAMQRQNILFEGCQSTKVQGCWPDVGLSKVMGKPQHHTVPLGQANVLQRHGTCEGEQGPEVVRHFHRLPWM